MDTTVLEYMTDVYKSDPDRFQENILKALVGRIVLTRYNNRTYRIDDIDFKRNPLSTFQTEDGPVSFKDYYKTQYNIDLRDMRQPVLVNNKAVSIPGTREKQELQFCVMPEITHLTGMDDRMRQDYVVMKDLATHTRLGPQQRFASYKKFIDNVKSNAEAVQILENWGLKLGSDPLMLRARALPEEQILFGKGKSCGSGPNADFSRGATNNEVLEAVDLHTWLIIYCERDDRAAKSFLSLFSKVTGPMGIRVSEPKVEVLRNDKTDTYVNALRTNLNNPKIQIVVIIFPTQRDDRYAAVKRMCCAENPVPSQVGSFSFCGLQ
jgi:aubergine-like protein